MKGSVRPAGGGNGPAGRERPHCAPDINIVFNGFNDICWQVREGAAMRDERNIFIDRPVFFEEKCESRAGR